MKSSAAATLSWVDLSAAERLAHLLRRAQGTT
jgi:hypothetical protein